MRAESLVKTDRSFVFVNINNLMGAILDLRHNLGENTQVKRGSKIFGYLLS